MHKTLFIFITLLMFWQSSNAQTRQEWRDSLFVLNRLIESNPKSLELKMRKAEANIMLEQWYYALDEYTAILDIYPSHIGALYFRAFVNNKLKKYAFARQDYEKVLGFAPDHKGALTGLIFVNLADKHFTKAFDQANHLVTLFPDSPESYAVRAQVEETGVMTDMAIDDISTAILMEEKTLPEGKTLAYDDNLTQYILQRIALLEQKGDKESMELAEADKKKLVSMGIPSKMLK